MSQGTWNTKPSYERRRLVESDRIWGRVAGGAIRVQRSSSIRVSWWYFVSGFRGAIIVRVGRRKGDHPVLVMGLTEKIRNLNLL